MELLAVIVVLAVIAIIAVPMILNIIDKAKIESQKASVREIYSAVMKKYVINNELITFDDDIMDKLHLKGEKPISGDIALSPDGKKFSLMVEYKNNCYMKSNNKEVVELKSCFLPKYYNSFNNNISNIEEIIENYSSSINVSETTNYKDTIINYDAMKNEYRFKGKDPANYLSYGGACFRIVSYSNSGIKIIYDGMYDATSENPCKHAFNGSVGLLRDKGSLNFLLYGNTGNWINSSIKQSFDELVNDETLNSSNNIMIDNINYGKLNLKKTEKLSLKKYDFYNGNVSEIITKETGTISLIETAEKTSVYNGYVGLITISEYLKASSSTDCVTYAPFGSGVETGNPCNDNNYLYKSYGYWTMNGVEGNASLQHYVPFKSYYYSSNTSLNLRPVFVLKGDTLFYGTGTYFDPYRLIY